MTLTSPPEPLRDAELETLKRWAASYEPTDLGRDVLRLISSEESHRKLAGSFEEAAGEWLGWNIFRDETGAEPQSEQDWVKSLASLLAAIHESAMEEAAQAPMGNFACLLATVQQDATAKERQRCAGIAENRFGQPPSDEAELSEGFAMTPQTVVKTWWAGVNSDPQEGDGKFMVKLTFDDVGTARAWTLFLLEHQPAAAPHRQGEAT